MLERLALAYAAGALSGEEHERRVELVLSARSEEDCAQSLNGVPELPGPARPEDVRPARSGHGESPSAEPSWSATGERFRDPRTGRIMRVWIDGRGGRHYVSETD